MIPAEQPDTDPDSAAARPPRIVLPVFDDRERFRLMIAGKTHVDQMDPGHCGAIENYRLHTGMFPFPLEESPCAECSRRE